MNASIQQLEYIVAIDTWRHFQTAADKCFVTQPTLSMQIQKLEDEVGFKIFDRNKKPVTCTEEGVVIVAQARRILAESQRLREIVSEVKGSLEGELRLGIIPTVAPYLLPVFLKQFLEKYSTITLQVSEVKTSSMLQMVRQGKLDVGILSTPINEVGLREELLYVEEFLVYISPNDALYNKQQLSAEDMAGTCIWLLEDGHCLRDQLIKFCALSPHGSVVSRFDYQAGSLETLKRMVDLNGGLTFIPKLATQTLSPDDCKNLREFVLPVPARKISLISNNSSAKQRLREVLKNEIEACMFQNTIGKEYVSLAHKQ